MKFLLFGTGDYYHRYKKWFEKESVSALMDNSIEKQNTVIDGWQVLSPEQALKKEYDYIVILSFYYDEMHDQLIRLGVESKRILHFFDLYKLNLNKNFKPQLFGISENDLLENKQKTILLLSTDLEIQGGPANVLIRFAQVLKKNGYSVVFGSMQDGPLKENLLLDGIPVVIDPNLQVKQMTNIEWTHGFQRVVCNTIGYCVFVSERDIDTPVIWWLHDSAFFYQGVNRELLSNMDCKNLNVYSVGKVPKQAIQNIEPDIEVGELLYGVWENGISRQLDEKNPDRICFIVLGYVEKRKGQDVLLESIRLLDEELLGKTQFYFVGNDSSEMAKRIKDQIKTIPQVIMTGKVSSEEKERLMNMADVLVCPSREDPMPASVVEAVMINKMPLVSDASGIADYIEDGVNGLTFENENIRILADKLEFCICNIDKVRKMGELARGIFDNHFSMDAFERRVMEII